MCTLYTYASHNLYADELTQVTGRVKLDGCQGNYERRSFVDKKPSRGMYGWLRLSHVSMTIVSLKFPYLTMNVWLYCYSES